MLVARETANANCRGRVSVSALDADFVLIQFHVFFRSLLFLRPHARHVQRNDVGRPSRGGGNWLRLAKNMLFGLTGSIVSSKAGIDALASAGFEDTLGILRVFGGEDFFCRNALLQGARCTFWSAALHRCHVVLVALALLVQLFAKHAGVPVQEKHSLPDCDSS